MASGYRIRAAKAVRIYCPVEAHTLAAMLAGDASALEQDATISKMLAIIRSGNTLGDFGIYKSVVEIAPGWELFASSPSARPTFGEAGMHSISPTAILTTYVAEDVPPEALDAALGAILAAHPWEVPVIEISEIGLLVRSEPATPE